MYQAVMSSYGEDDTLSLGEPGVIKRYLKRPNGLTKHQQYWIGIMGLTSPLWHTEHFLNVLYFL